MISVEETQAKYCRGEIDKPTFIRLMYEQHHSSFFDYADYLKKTNIKKIEIEDGRVVMTTRDRGVRISCGQGDFRIAPIETLNFFDYEKSESDMMESLFLDGQNYFDIGANIGYYSINLALSRRAAKMYCFEPIPTTYESLLTNLALNSVPNVIPHNFGFADKSGEFPFYYYGEGSGNASSANVSGRADVVVVPCKVRTLDDYISETNIRVDFIKCDVEGAELLVFKGAQATISRDKPIVFSEILRKWSAKFNYNPNDIFKFFRQQGYRVFTVNEGCLIDFFDMTEGTLETNFFFLHQEKHFDLIRRYARDGFVT